MYVFFSVSSVEFGLKLWGKRERKGKEWSEEEKEEEEEEIVELAKFMENCRSDANA